MARRTLPALAAVAALALAGCSNSAEKAAPKPPPPPPSTSATTPPAPRPHVPPATGPLLAGTGYSLHAPRGWRVRGRLPDQPLVQVAATAPPDRSGYAPNLNVIVSNTGVDMPDEAQLKAISATIVREIHTIAPKVQVNPTTTIAGQPALDHEALASKNGQQYALHQFVVFRDGKAYTITFTFGRSATAAQRNAVIDPVLSSWKWR